MSTQAPPVLETRYTPPTMDEVNLALVESRIIPTLYRAGIDWYSWSYLGETLWIPPHLTGEPMVEAPRRHPAHGTTQRFKADGKLVIRARIGEIWDDKPGKGRFNTHVRGVLPGWSPHEIVGFALLNHTDRGIVLLRGDEALDTLAMAHSRKLVYAAKYAWADQHRKARAEEVQRFRGNPLNANVPDPPASPIQKQAQAWLDEFAAADTSQRYKCKYGCSDWSDRDLYVRHMQVAHRETPPADEQPVDVELEAKAILDEADKRAKDLEAREKALIEREAALAAREEKSTRKGGTKA